MGCTCSHPRLSQTEPLRDPNTQPSSGTMPLLAVFSLMLLPTAKRFSPIHVLENRANPSAGAGAQGNLNRRSGGLPSCARLRATLTLGCFHGDNGTARD